MEVHHHTRIQEGAQVVVNNKQEMIFLRKNTIFYFFWFNIYIYIHIIFKAFGGIKTEKRKVKTISNQH